MRKIIKLKQTIILGVILLVLLGGLSFYYFAVYRTRAAENVTVTFDLNQKEFWSSHAQQKYNYLQKLDQGKVYPDITKAVRTKIDRLWQEKLISDKPGKVFSHPLDKEMKAYVTAKDMNYQDRYMPANAFSATIDQLLAVKKIDKLPGDEDSLKQYGNKGKEKAAEIKEDTFEMVSNRKFKKREWNYDPTEQIVSQVKNTFWSGSAPTGKAINAYNRASSLISGGLATTALSTFSPAFLMGQVGQFIDAIIKYSSASEQDCQLTIWRMSALTTLQNNLSVKATNLDSSGTWVFAGSLYDQSKFQGQNRMFSPKTGNALQDLNLSYTVPGRNYAVKWNGEHLKSGGKNTEETFVPGFTDRQIDLSSIKVNGKSLKDSGFDAEVVLATNTTGNSPQNSGVIASSSAKWNYEYSAANKNNYGAWLSNEVNVWIKIKKGNSTLAPGNYVNKEADFDRNGKIDYLDLKRFILMRDNFAEEEGNKITDLNRSADFNRDNKIDDADLKLLMSVWGNKGSSVAEPASNSQSQSTPATESPPASNQGTTTTNEDNSSKSLSN